MEHNKKSNKYFESYRLHMRTAIIINNMTYKHLGTDLDIH
jgi:hypothetical protein